MKIPIWEIKYSYTTIRNNHKTYYKYFIADETSWDIAEIRFYQWLESFNNDNSERKLSNVKILDMEFLGVFELELE